MAPAGRMGAREARPMPLVPCRHLVGPYHDGRLYAAQSLGDLTLRDVPRCVAMAKAEAMSRRLEHLEASGRYEKRELRVPVAALGHVTGVAVGEHPDGKVGVILLVHPPHGSARFEIDLPVALSELDLEEIAECARDMHKATIS
jgi:hypothetical protein